MITTDAEVKMERLISDSLAIFTVRPEKLVKWSPGMFLQLSLSKKTASEPWLDSKPFSIASWGGSEIKIIVRKEGKFTSSLFDLGRSVFSASIKYPLGNFYLKGRENKIFMAGGAGISVFTSYLDYIIKENINDDLTIFHSSKSKEELLTTFYWFELKKNIKFYHKVTRINNSKSGGNRSTYEELQKLFEVSSRQKVYICGPASFTEYWYKVLVTKGFEIRKEQWVVS